MRSRPTKPHNEHIKLVTNNYNIVYTVEIKSLSYVSEIPEATTSAARKGFSETGVVPSSSTDVGQIDIGLRGVTVMWFESFTMKNAIFSRENSFGVCRSG